MGRKIIDVYLDYLASLVGENRRFRNKSKLAEYADITPSQLNKYQSRDSLKNVKKFLDFLEKIGGHIAFDDEQSPARDVMFVSPKIMAAGEHITPPDAKVYAAAPLVGEVGAGAGYFPEDDVKSWFLIYKDLPAIRARKNLIAVEIGKGSTSMQPTLNPEDIVLVDRDDTDISWPGHIMLVRDPVDGSGMIKRVNVVEVKGGDFQLTFYSDNAAQYPPQVYSLNKDFDGEWEKAIVGRVIWLWADIRSK